MDISFLGAAHEVTGSCTMIRADGLHILVDCGMEQGPNIYENCDIPVNPSEIDFVLLTHAHIDHSGKLPALVAKGFSGKIYCTEATAKLCSIMLRDSAHIQEFEAEWKNRKAKRAGEAEYVPLYTMNDVEKTLELIVPMSYHQEFSPAEGVKVSFSDAGHLLGSASITIEITENSEVKKVLFSGDLGNVSRPLIRDPEKPSEADFVVIESTYGNRLHGDRPDYIKQLSEIIQRTFDRGGNVVIPSFAIGRTQEMLYLIRIIKEKGLVKNHDGFKVYVDSPLAVAATNIYTDDMLDYYDSETLSLVKNGINPIVFGGLKLSVTSDESKLINTDSEPKVILSASGMCEAGRIRHHLKHNLWRKESTVLFVGYQSDGTLGRSLINGAKTVKLFGERIAVEAEIAVMEGISGHADMNMLLGWLGSLKNPPQKVFVNHGEDLTCEEFSKTIFEKLGFSAEAPYSGSVYSLETGECLVKGNSARLEKPVQKRASTVFDRLVAAGKRLLSVIEKNRGGANKDLAKFADQINSLSDKWEP